MSIEPNRSARWGWVGGLALMTLAAAGNHTRAAETIPLNDEITVSFTIPANTYTNAFYFEVPENTRKFRLEMDGTPTANTDLDLFIRYGEPFPDANAYGLTPSNIERGFEWLADLSHYQSISFGNEEFVVVSEHAVRPPKAGRWHAAVVNFSAVPVNATLRLDLLPDEAPTPATITVRFDLPCTAADGAGCQCDLTGWNDPAPALPAPGNTGTTLGQQRRIALEEATRRIAQNFSTEAPIVIRACWAELEADATSAVLAQAGTEGLFIDDSGLFSGTASNPRPGRRQAFLPEAHAWYAAAPTTKSGGTSFCRVSGGPCESRVDVTATFNSLIDTPTGLGAASFYYGLNPPSQGAIDFIGVAMHEITHGLGFLSIISLGTGSAAVGTEFRGRDDIYERQILVTNRETPELLSRLSDSDRGNALTAGNGLQWISPEAVASPLNDPRPGEVGVRMYAPNPIRAGSSLSHLDLFYRGELMVPSSNAQLGARELFLAAPMLNAVGWDPAPRQFPTSPVPLSGQWYDRDRAGHGIDFQRVYTSPDGYEIYSLLFYSYDQNGNPEWFLAIGPVVDGVFLADANEFDSSLVAYLYQSDRFPPQRPNSARRGQVRLDFNQAKDSFACSDGTQRDADIPLASFSWSVDSTSGNWCMEPLIGSAERTGLDLTGTWYAGTGDQGWGASIATAQRDDSQLLFALIYYPDANGGGRWAFALTEDYVPGQSLTLFQRQGYCRTCTATALVDTAVGSLTPDLRNATQEDLSSGNLIGLEVTYGSAPGGNFARPADSPFTLLSAPAEAQ